MSNIKFTIFITVLLSVNCTSCKKYLNAKSDQELAIPSSIQDFQALLDDHFQNNERNPNASEVSSDDYYLTQDGFEGLLEFDRRKYVWDNQVQFPKGAGFDWSNAYSNVYKANITLSNIDNVKRKAGDENSFNICKGHALYLRAQAYLQVAGIWAQAYDDATASQQLGIPLRVDPDFNKVSTRATLFETYSQIIEDLTQAADLLPAKAIHVLRPSKASAFGLLARTYLFMRKYDQSEKYANQCLQIEGTLVDYNEISNDPLFPFGPRFSNKEILTDYQMAGNTAIFFFNAKIDSNLYRSYNDNDLRKQLFFRDNGDGTFAFRGNYTGGVQLFNGVATDEIYLIRAESYARNGKINEAMKDLNDLLKKRWVINHSTGTTTYVDQTANSSNDAVQKILIERRKELLMRGLRWMDIKRLNKEGNDIVLSREIAGQTIKLQPNSPAFALAIPEDVVALSGIQQNPE